MEYRFGMQSYNNLDQESYLQSGTLPREGESLFVEYSNAFIFCMLNKQYVDFSKSSQRERLEKHPNRKWIEENYPSVNFDFFDYAKDYEQQYKKGPWILYEPVEILSAFQCLEKIIHNEKLLDKLMDELCVFTIARDKEIHEYIFKETFEFCDKTIEWNQKVITFWS